MIGALDERSTSKVMHSTTTYVNPSYSVEECRTHFDDVMRHATDEKQHVVLTQNGEPVAAVIPIEALGLLDHIFEALEDEVDMREVRRIREDEDAEYVPIEEAFRELGLDDEDET